MLALPDGESDPTVERKERSEEVFEQRRAAHYDDDSGARLRSDNPGAQARKKLQFRLVGDDKLLVKAITFVSSKTGAEQRFWPAVVPRTLVHAVPTES